MIQDTDVENPRITVFNSFDADRLRFERAGVELRMVEAVDVGVEL